MARQKTGDKLNDIKRATVAEVVEVGSSAASVAAIAKRAGLASGTIYRYHANKDALLRSVYLSVKTDIFNATMTAADRQNTDKDKLRAMWFAILEYAHDRPKDFLFAEVIVTAVPLSPEEAEQIAAMSADMSAVIEDAVADKTLRPGAVTAITTLLVGPALHLGRQSAVSGKPLNSDECQEVFDLCWQAIAT